MKNRCKLPHLLHFELWHFHDVNCFLNQCETRLADTETENNISIYGNSYILTQGRFKIKTRMDYVCRIKYTCISTFCAWSWSMRPGFTCMENCYSLIYWDLYCTICLRKISSIGRPRIERSSANGPYHSITRVMGLFPTRLRPESMTNWYCPIYCNPFAMSWTGAHLCTLDWLDGPKENCHCSSLVSICGSIVLLQLLLVHFEF